MYLIKALRGDGMNQTLINKAKEALKYAYVPYSKFQVGAAVQMTSGNIYTGSNIENASFSLTCCAERTAIFKAISEGEKDFASITVVADTEGPVSPCGSCRQVMAEFFTDETTIYLTNLKDERYETNISGILPFYFKL